MTRYLPDQHLRAAFVRAFNVSSQKERYNIFGLVSGVIGCDESEMASLAVDLCPDDWRAYFAMAKFRQIRARWCELEGGLFIGKHLPAHAAEVLNIFIHTYRLAQNENQEAEQEVTSYINAMEKDDSYRVLAREIKKQISREG